MITLDEVRSQLSYNKRTGHLTWEVNKPRIRKGLRAGSWHIKGHREITVCGQVFREHRLIWWMVTGQDPGDLYIDHKNMQRDDNRWCNLRKATHSQNYINSKTFGPMRGIVQRGPRTFRVRTIVDGRRRSFHVRTLVAAKQLRRKLEIKEWGEFACRR